MMQSENPRAGQGARVEKVHCGGRIDLNRTRPILQATPAMFARLALLKWGMARGVML
jgi:hypothetical protein